MQGAERGGCRTRALWYTFRQQHKKKEKEGPQGNILEIFVLDILKTTFWIRNLRWTQSRPLFPKSRLFLISKIEGEVSPLPSSCVPVSVAEYALISLNMPKYPWRCLNKLFWLYRSSGYAWSSYMFDRFLKLSWVLNKPGFWTWHNCMCNSYAKSRIRLIMVLYASIMPEYASVRLSAPSIYLNIAEYYWIFLNIQGLNKLLWLCQGSQYVAIWL